MHKIIRFNEIDSSNSYIKRNYKNLLDQTVVITNHQTEGRGRMNRPWLDNDDLLFSILIKDNIQNPSNLSLLVASIVYEFINKYCANVLIKWPNDIMVNDKKVCGILLEAVTYEEIECVVIGIGINVNTISFNDDLLIKATSLKLENDLLDFDKNLLLKEFLEIFDRCYNEYLNNKSNYLEICKNNSYLIGKTINIDSFGKIQKAKVLDILANGNILLFVNGEEKEFSSGEVLLKDVYLK